MSATVERRKAKKRRGVSQHFGPGKTSEHYTPRRYVDAARNLMGKIDLDPASCAKANEVVGAAAYFTRATNGLIRPWFGNVWLNPPYSDYPGQAAEWAAKLHEEYVVRRVSQAIMLVNMNVVYQPAFQRIAKLEIAICLVDHRIQYIDEAGNVQERPTQSQIIYYLGNYRSKFRESFKEFGAILWS